MADLCKWLSTLSAIVVAFVGIMDMLPEDHPTTESQPQIVIAARFVFIDNGSMYALDYNNDLIKLNDTTVAEMIK